MSELDRKQERAPVPSDWTYAPAPESRDIVQLRERYGLFVGGEWVEPRETYTTISPATEEPLAEVAQATPEDVDLAVQAARAAFENGWSKLRALRAREVPVPDRARSSRSARASSPCSSR